MMKLQFRAEFLAIMCAVAGCAAAPSPAGEPSFHQRALAEARRTIDPQADWNRQAKQFIAPPVLRLDGIAKDGESVFVVGSDGARHELIARGNVVSLESIWEKLPVGTTRVRDRTFHRAAMFDGPYRSAVVPYDESARLALQTLIREPFVRSWLTSGEPDAAGYPLYRYCAKIIGSLVGGCAVAAKEVPSSDDRAAAIEIGRAAGDYLISISQPAGSPLEFMPPTYHGATPTERENDRWTMMMTPAEAAQGYLDFFEVTQDRKYRDAAVRIAQTYAKTQAADGTWWLKVDNVTGEPVAQVKLIPSEVIRFLDRLDDPRFQKTLDRAVKWMLDNPVRTFDWKAQFDDAKVRGPYENLSKHEACEFACYLLEHRQHADVALEILRWAEDQFVVWEKPPEFPPRQGIEQLAPKHWITPCSCEQYAMFEPVSGSSAFMIVAYVRAYEVTHDPLHLAKARSLANALTVAQQMHDGRYPTRMIEHDLAYWLNSTVNTSKAMLLLAGMK
jgi:maltose/maltodextrin transport system substrate-binding protein